MSTKSNNKHPLLHGFIFVCPVDKHSSYRAMNMLNGQLNIYHTYRKNKSERAKEEKTEMFCSNKQKFITVENHNFYATSNINAMCHGHTKKKKQKFWQFMFEQIRIYGYI